MTFRFLPALLLVPSLAATLQEAPQGKVRVFISADTESTYRDVKQRASDLDETARDVRKSLKKSRWVEVTESIEEADVRVRILGRRKTDDQGLALGYALEAGDFKTGDEFVYGEKAAPSSRGMSTDSDRVGGNVQGQRRLAWNEVSSYFGESLALFAKSNYELILARRK